MAVKYSIHDGGFSCCFIWKKKFTKVHCNMILFVLHHKYQTNTLSSHCETLNAQVDRFRKTHTVLFMGKQKLLKEILYLELKGCKAAGG